MKMSRIPLALAIVLVVLMVFVVIERNSPRKYVTVYISDIHCQLSFDDAVPSEVRFEGLTIEMQNDFKGFSKVRGPGSIMFNHNRTLVVANDVRLDGKTLKCPVIIYKDGSTSYGFYQDFE